MKRRFFGTDGIRAAVPGSFLNQNFADRLGRALASPRSPFPASPHTPFLIARDTRSSGAELAQGLAQGLRSKGASVHDLGVMPTPALSAMIRQSGTWGGAMITASHNPHTDNGIKLFRSGGEKWTDEAEVVLESLLPPDESSPSASSSWESNKSSPASPTPWQPEFLYQRFAKTSLAPLHVVFDAANGAASSWGKEVLNALGLKASWINNSPDGTNINRGCGSEHPESLQRAVLEAKADIGFALDGDADRLVVVDSHGEAVPGDQILGIFATALSSPEHPEVVLTEQSNAGLEETLRSLGHPVFRTPVGDRYVWREMNARGALFGGENSGHFLARNHLPCSDGLGFALSLWQILTESNASLEDLRNKFPLMPAATRNLQLASKPPLEDLPDLLEEVENIRSSLGGRGRILLRYSGTEPKLRLLVEHPDSATAHGTLDQLATTAQRFLPLQTSAG